MDKNYYREKIAKMIDYLSRKEKILFLVTSDRWSGEKGGEIPKSTLLAQKLKNILGQGKVSLVDVSKLIIHNCEGNVSTARGNTCGEREAVLKDKEKNPTGFHRCWASVNNEDDELWKVSRELFQSHAVVFFGSVRWGQMNAFYQKLIERLTWIENRHATFKENNVIKDIDAGLVAIGHNWNVDNVVGIQKQVLGFFGFKTPDELFIGWQYTQDAKDESDESYKKAFLEFEDTFLK